jgi:hypothetical protein
VGKLDVFVGFMLCGSASVLHTQQYANINKKFILLIYLIVMYNPTVEKPLAVLMLRPDRELCALLVSNANTEQHGQAWKGLKLYKGVRK